MNAKRLGAGVGTAGTTGPIPHGLTRLHLLGVGLDFLFDRHDSESADERWGRAAESLVRAAPFSFFPNPNNAHAAARKKTRGEAGSYIASLGAGSQEAGLPRRRGSRSPNPRLQRPFRLQESGPFHERPGIQLSETNQRRMRSAI